MIERCFRFLEGISYAGEKRLIEQGIVDWESFLKAKKIKGIRQARKAYYDRKLLKARKMLYSGDSSYFYNVLPLREHWRLYKHLKDEAVYIDIEVNGIGKHSYITVIGLYDRYEPKVMIKGINLDINKLSGYLKNFRYIISFNGTVFDSPFIKKRYPNLLPRVPHMDLRFLCRRAGFPGGLKEIEKKLGIRRNIIVERFHGGDPLKLYRMFLASGNRHYLDLLVEYNSEDVMNLETIADAVYSIKSFC